MPVAREEVERSWLVPDPGSYLRGLSSEWARHDQLPTPIRQARACSLPQPPCGCAWALTLHLPRWWLVRGPETVAGVGCWPGELLGWAAGGGEGAGQQVGAPPPGSGQTGPGRLHADARPWSWLGGRAWLLRKLQHLHSHGEQKVLRAATPHPPPCISGPFTPAPSTPHTPAGFTLDPAAVGRCWPSAGSPCGPFPEPCKGGGRGGKGSRSQHGPLRGG